MRRNPPGIRYFLCAFLPVLLFLHGCGVVVVGAGVSTGAVVGHDRRSAGAFVDDQVIELKALKHLHSDEDLWSQSHISTTSFNNIVLLSGEVPNDFLRERAAGLVGQIPEIRYLHNELIVAAPSSALSRTSDSWITGKVKMNFASDERIDATRIKIVTERGAVYLMGLVTRREGELATDIARRVGGVQRVVKLFEYI